MKAGDKVLISAEQGGEHWIYASVIHPWADDKGALVVVEHPGNVDDGKMRNVKREGIRTKADLEPLLEDAKTFPAHEVIKGAGPERRRWVEHYTHQMSVLD